MIALIAAGGAALALGLALVRLFAGPTLYDRTLAMKSVVTRAALVCAAIAVAFGATAWVDVAMAMLLGLLVVMTAVSKVFRARTFQAPLARGDG
jgi:multicomponent Na+:H+ antiporter subunit F